MMAAFVGLLGTLTGILETVLLWRAVRSGVQPFGTAFRFVLVGSVLYLSAAAGHWLSGLAGWVAGFAASGTIIAMKGR